MEREQQNRKGLLHKVKWIPNAKRVNNGKLKITTSYSGKLDENGNLAFYSRGVVTTGKFQSDFGYYDFEVCILKGAPGVNSAFWLMAPKVHPLCCEGRDAVEIDVVEMPWPTGQIQHSMHWDGYSNEHHKHSSHIIKTNSSGIMLEIYLTVAVWWNPHGYIFYIDGKEICQASDGGVSQAKDTHLFLSSMVLANRGVTEGESFNVDVLLVWHHVKYVCVYSSTKENSFQTGII